MDIKVKIEKSNLETKTKIMSIILKNNEFYTVTRFHILINYTKLSDKTIQEINEIFKHT
jgi:hypothetical protein